MMSILTKLSAATLMVTMTGCLGTQAADRTLQIYQLQSTETYAGPFIIDTSQLPPDAVESRVKSGPTGPRTLLTVKNDYAVKVQLVPVTTQVDMRNDDRQNAIRSRVTAVVVSAIMLNFGSAGCMSPEARQITRHGGRFVLPEKGHGIDFVFFSTTERVDDDDFAAAFPALGRLPELTRLGLAETDITDESLKLVARLKHLEWLDTTRTRVTAGGLRELQRLPSLQYLYVPRSLSNAELAELRKLMCKVRIEPGGKESEGENEDVANSKTTLSCGLPEDEAFNLLADLEETSGGCHAEIESC